MITAIVVLVILTSILLSILVLFILKIRQPERTEKVRLDREMYRAEFRLHEMAGEAFTALLEAARSGGLNRSE